MKKILLIASGLLLTTTSTFAATPQEAYQALVDSYSNIPVLQDLNFDQMGQNGTVQVYINETRKNGDKASFRIGYQGVANKEMKNAKADLAIKGSFISEGVTTAVKAGISIVAIDKNVFIKLSSLDFESNEATESEDLVMISMMTEQIMGQWIQLPTSDVSEEYESDELMPTSPFSMDEKLKKIGELFKNNQVFDIGNQIAPGKYAVIFNKEFIAELMNIVGGSSSNSEESQSKIVGYINTDIVNPVLTINKSSVDKNTIIKGSWTKEKIVLHLSELIEDMDSTLTFARKLNGFGISYKDNKLMKIDASYTLTPSLNTLLRVRISDGEILARIEAKGKMYDAASETIAAPTNAVSLEDIFGDMSSFEE